MSREVATPEGVTYQRTSTDAHWFKCDSLAAATALAAAPAPHNAATYASVGGHPSESGEWYGTRTIGEAADILRAGEWAAGVSRMQTALGDMGATLTPRNIRRTRRWAEQGDFVDMPRVWAGRLDAAWQHTQRLQRHGPQSVTIVAKIGARSGVSADTLFWRGAAALKLADLLTEAGYNVELEAAHTSEAVSSGAGFALTIPLKQATAPLDLNALAVTVCLAGYYRLSVFQMKCACPGHVGRGFGKTCRYRTLIREQDDNRACILLDEQAYDATSARAWIASQISALEQPCT